VRVPPRAGISLRIGHIRSVGRRSLLISVAAAASGAILVTASGAATTAPGAPGQPQGASGGDRASLNQNSPRGGGGNRGNGSRPVIPTPIITPQVAPATPFAPPVRLPSVVTPSNQDGGPPSSGSGGISNPGSGTPPANPVPGGAAASGSGTGSAGGGHSDAPAAGGGSMATVVPDKLPVSGRSAGSGPVGVTIYMDLSDPSDAATYLSVTTALLARVAADRSATITFSPIIVGSDPNGMEAAAAVLAGTNQNRTWCVTAQLAVLRSTRGGDWLNRTALTEIARSCRLSSRRFVRDASGNRLYPRLNAIRAQAKAHGVDTTPCYVVKGNGGSQIVKNPGGADAVASAISDAS